MAVRCMLLSLPPTPLSSLFFFSTDTATTEIYTLSLHDALPISAAGREGQDELDRLRGPGVLRARMTDEEGEDERQQFHAMTFRDRKSTRLNSSHPSISYAVFCLKKKKKKNNKP